MNCPDCQGPSKFQDRRDKSFVSLMGQIVLQRRAYYHCRYCHAGHVPLDATLGLSECKLTPAAEELVSLAGTLDSLSGRRRVETKRNLTALSSRGNWQRASSRGSDDRPPGTNRVTSSRSTSMTSCDRSERSGC